MNVKTKSSKQARKAIWHLFCKIMKQVPSQPISQQLLPTELAQLAEPYFLELIDKHRIANVFYEVIVKMTSPENLSQYSNQLKPLKNIW